MNIVNISIAHFDKNFTQIQNKLEKVDMVITDTPAFQIFIQKSLKFLSSKRKRAIIHER